MSTNDIIRDRRTLLVVAVTLTAILGLACAAIQPRGATGPHRNEPPYPVLLTEDEQRHDRTLVYLRQVASEHGWPANIQPSVEPITATVRSLPENPPAPVYLPKIGDSPTMNDQETTESLRRFITSWQRAIGADPSQLTLIEIKDQTGGTKLATYEQRPFRYLLQGNYGELKILFATDRRVLNVNSSCLPDIERIQTALAATPAQLKAEDAIKRVTNSSISYAGATAPYQLSASNVITADELVVYVKPSTNRQDALEFHLAWELSVTNAPVKKIFVDAVTGETIAAS
jgi:hypothetical protein